MQSTTNPFLKANAELMHEKHLFTRNAHLIYIVGLCKSENNYDPSDYLSVSTFCKEYYIDFDIQALSSGIEEDREFVKRLPAYQVYYKDEYECTFYNEDSVSAILISLFTKPKPKKINWMSYFSFTLPRRKISIVSNSSPM